MMIKNNKCLTDDIKRRIYMSDGSCQPYPKGGTNQSGPYLAAAVPALARGCPAIGPRLLDLRTSGYRYLEQAQQLKRPISVGDAKVSFTVKLSRSLVDRLRAYAASTGLTLSEIASRAYWRS